MDLPGGTVDESACVSRGHGFDSWSGKIPYATEQLSPCTTNTDPMKPMPRVCALQEKSPQ